MESITCRKCNNDSFNYTYDEEHKSTIIECQKCGNKFRAPKEKEYDKRKKRQEQFRKRTITT